MGKSAVTSTKEDYLRSIYYLEQKHGRSPKVTEVATYLSLSKSTVSERLQDLAKRGFITYSKYRPIVLLASGKTVGETLTTKHRIIEVFLHKILKRPVAELHEEAHKLEHAFSDESIEALKTLLGNPKADPHGSPIG